MKLVQASADSPQGNALGGRVAGQAIIDYLSIHGGKFHSSMLTPHYIAIDTPPFFQSLDITQARRIFSKV